MLRDHVFIRPIRYYDEALWSSLTDDDCRVILARINKVIIEADVVFSDGEELKAFAGHKAEGDSDIQIDWVGFFMETKSDDH